MACRSSSEPSHVWERKFANHRLGAGEFDGDEFAADLSDGSIYMYGADADRLLGVVRPVLESAPFMAGAVVHVRYGPPGSHQIKVVIGATE